SPIGIFTNGRDIIVLQTDEIPLRKKRLRHKLLRATTASEVIYNQWEIVIHSFESSLDIIEMTIKRAEAAIQTEIYPTRLNEFFTLTSDAVFMEAALKANMRVLRRLKRVLAFGRMILDEDRLEELEVDLQQQVELSGIYMRLIDNAMNAYDTIVGHNMNTVMKVLTSVSLLVNVPTLVASIYGMNVGIPPEQNLGPFLVIMALTATLTIPVYLYLRLKDLV
ncbi:MAG: CorA family divalent cation transporter, partial [Candidatus Thorarchaeota archaeon]